MTSPIDIFRQSVQASLDSVNTCLPGIIVAYDPATNKATIQPALNKAFFTGPMPQPILENVPVMFPRGGNFTMTFPIAAGDTVLLVFSQRSLDLWLSVGGQVTPSDPRKFDLSDAIAIPGLVPFNSDFPENDNESFTINIGDSRFKISSTGTLCFHGVSEELMAILSEMIDLISQITVLASPAPDPVLIPITQSAAFTALQARFDTLKGNC